MSQETSPNPDPPRQTRYGREGASEPAPLRAGRRILAVFLAVILLSSLGLMAALPSVRAAVYLWSGWANLERAAAGFDADLDLLIERAAGRRMASERTPRRAGFSRWSLRRERIAFDQFPGENFLAQVNAAAKERGLSLRRLGGASAPLSGMVVLEARYSASPTHILRLRIPAPAGPRLAILIDDVGYNEEVARRLMALGIPLSLAVLPHLPYSKRIARAALARGLEVLLHLPLEPHAFPRQDPGPGSILSSQRPEEWRALTRRALDAVPGITGVNNHMGSRLTEREDAMAVILSEVKKRGLYFIDSYTTGKTVAYRVARRIGMRTARRTVFLDNEVSEEKILVQIDLLIKKAKEGGSAIGIGHPHEATVRALEAALPRLRRSGVRLVPAGALVR